MCQYKHDHQNDKQFMCKVCDLIFKSKEEIDTHVERTHIDLVGEENQKDSYKIISETEQETNESPALCLGCGTEFKEVDDLIDHYMETYHNIEEDESLAD